ncbi:hypothetical protein Cni_G09217 [Canna indica]|uniref:Cytochrome P450 n=1 Tax=Canna indica TaxID=4628 RepID=A0AAQ3K1W0_9LILI|nr:hypothetical protein Cni_G09217 [Canna indica]
MDLRLLCLVLFPLSLFLLIHRDSRRRRRCTGIKSYPFLGILPQFVKNRHRFLDWSTEALLHTPTHTMSFVSPGQVGGVITANPSNVEHILKTNFGNYPKGERSSAMLVDFLGHGIFNSDGDEWKWQRKQASYEFSKRSLRNFIVHTVQSEIVHRLLPLLRKAAEEQETLDLQDVLERFAFDSICKVAFNEDPACLSRDATSSSKTSRFMKAFEEAQNLIMVRFMAAIKFAWRVKKLLNIGSEKQLKKRIAIVHDYAMEIIRARRAKAASQLDDHHDLLSRFASDDDNSEEFLRDVVTNFLLAGRETTSSALTWFFWLLSSRPDVEEKILEEVKAVRASSKNASEAFSLEELREMHYIHAAVTESMRLYPPVPIDTVACVEDDAMPDGTFVGKGWAVSYSAYSMGRMEAVWGKDCNEYRPERWLENGVFRPESPFRYPVFHAGPRMCLGKEMAYIQMKSIIACVVERFEISVVKEEKTPEHVLSLTLRMKGGLPIKIKEKVSNA